MLSLMKLSCKVDHMQTFCNKTECKTQALLLQYHVYRFQIFSRQTVCSVKLMWMLYLSAIFRTPMETPHQETH